MIPWNRYNFVSWAQKVTFTAKEKEKKPLPTNDGTGQGLSAFTRIYSLFVHTGSALQTFICPPCKGVNGRDRLLGFSRTASWVLGAMFCKGAGPVGAWRKRVSEAPVCVWPEQPQAPPSGRPEQGGRSAEWRADQQAFVKGQLSQAATPSTRCNYLTFKVCAMFKDFKNNDSISHQGHGQGCFGQRIGPPLTACTPPTRTALS